MWQQRVTSLAIGVVLLIKLTFSGIRQDKSTLQKQIRTITVLLDLGCFVVVVFIILF